MAAPKRETRKKKREILFEEGAQIYRVPTPIPNRNQPGDLWDTEKLSRPGGLETISSG